MMRSRTSVSTAVSDWLSRDYGATVTVDNYSVADYVGYSPSGTLTRSTATALSTARRELAAGSVGDYALFGGGDTGSGSYYAVVDAYNTSLTRSTPTALSTARYGLAAGSVGDYALFGGGYAGSVSAVVDAYNTSLTRSTPTALSVARDSLAAGSVGNYALFGGGITGSASAVVDAYRPESSFATFKMPIGTTYNFGNGEQTATTQNVGARVPVNGYIKYKNGTI